MIAGTKPDAGYYQQIGQSLTKSPTTISDGDFGPSVTKAQFLNKLWSAVSELESMSENQFSRQHLPQRNRDDDHFAELCVSHSLSSLLFRLPSKIGLNAIGGSSKSPCRANFRLQNCRALAVAFVFQEFSNGLADDCCG